MSAYSQKPTFAGADLMVSFNGVAPAPVPLRPFQIWAGNQLNRLATLTRALRVLLGVLGADRLGAGLHR